jgi:2-polyprenyl-3-methyl-5-hydroxy-6-metoxy-1,4-benzoquinol methylase
MRSGTHGYKRLSGDSLEAVQERNRGWWERTPMTYDWYAAAPRDRDLEWFNEQDRLSVEAHRFFATDRSPFDRLIPFPDIRGRRVLEIGVGAGFHAELMARAGAEVTGIDLTDAAISTARRRFDLKGLEGRFVRWDAEQPLEEFDRRFDFIWSWGVIHHSARTARIVRNIAGWLADSGQFAGMVYHREAMSTASALFLHGILGGRLWSRSIDEMLWRSTDGFSARFYPAEIWRDSLLGFFEEAQVDVSGLESDILPLPRALRRVVVKRISIPRARVLLARWGSFVTFNATHPLRP